MVDGVCVWIRGSTSGYGERGGIAGESRRAPRVSNDSGVCGVPVAESVLAPPGPIPNPVVTQHSAGEYCGGNAVGGEAAAGIPHRQESLAHLTRGGAVAARWAHNPKVGGSNPSPATTRMEDLSMDAQVRSCFSALARVNLSALAPPPS